MWLLGEGGCGKSFLIREIQKQLDSLNIGYKSCCPTASGALEINGETMHKLLSINPIEAANYTKTSMDTLASRGVQYIFVDEASMVDTFMWKQLMYIKDAYNFKLIVSGDLDGQLLPTSNGDYPADITVKDSFMYICDYRRLELTENWRLKNDPDAASLILDLRALRCTTSRKEAREVIGKIVPRYGTEEHPLAICWTNVAVDGINKRWNEHFAAEASDVTQIGDIKVHVGARIVTKKNVDDLINGERFTVSRVTKKEVVLTNERGTKSVDHDSFRKYCALGYAITCHSAQGKTFREPYTIYEWDAYRGEDLRRWLYTAMSRASSSSQVNFGNWKSTLCKMFIYKITGPDGKCYIGSTDRNCSLRWAEHVDFTSEKKSKIQAAIEKQGAEAFTFEVLEKVMLPRERNRDMLRKVEQKWINKYDSVRCGYNQINAAV